MVVPEPTPLILFSGLAADSNVFVPQKVAFPQLIVRHWPTPLPSDTLRSYCDRLADELRTNAPAIIGGASFGGIIALHVAERLDPLAAGTEASPGSALCSVLAISLEGFARVNEASPGQCNKPEAQASETTGTDSVFNLVRRAQQQSKRSPSWRKRASEIEATLHLNTEHKD